MTVQNQSPKNNVYEAAVGWVEGVTQTQFTGCVVTAGKGFSYRKLSADWLAFQGTPSGSQTGRRQFLSLQQEVYAWIHIFQR